MPRKIIIVGAGIIGAAIAHALRDHDVIVVDAGPVAGGASGRSFGWVNASFFADEAHHRLRAAALAAWREIPHMDMAGMSVVGRAGGWSCGHASETVVARVSCPAVEP
ncbi:MAG: FAD-dependent oxidoreductase [Pseudomonadota bacterium]